MPIAGIVFGPLNNAGFPDLDLISKIAGITRHPITYHKAIDSTKDILQSTQMLIDQNKVQYILSSGAQPTAIQGMDTLNQMNVLLKESEISLIAAGSITADNLSKLHENLQLSYYHGKRIVGNLTETS